MDDFRFSKSSFCRGYQCPKMLWLEKHLKDEFDDSVKNESVLSNGNDVGDLAMSLFGEYTEVPQDNQNLSNMVATTKKLIEDGVKTICEASFTYDNCFCSADILRNLGNNNFELYEVKSSTSVHDIYRYDVAYQYYILTHLGMNVKKASLVYINNKYVRKGEIEIDKLFLIEDLTEDVISKQEEIEEKIKSIREYQKTETEPKKEIGPYCKDPYECGFFAHCAKDLVESKEMTVFNVRGLLTKWDRYEMYNKGVVTFKDILDNNLHLSEAQKLQVETEVKDLPPHIDKDKIKSFLSTVSYPIYFLDFESYMPCIPPFDGTHPYQQIVTQYSLHILEKEGEPLIHKEFLAYPDQDTMYEVGKHLCEDIPYGETGSVMIYNKGFEPARIREIMKLHPEMTKTLQAINNRIVDLQDPFQKRWYYAKPLQGSYSIKYVLPTLCPNDPSLDYSKLDGIHNGGEAMNIFPQMKNMDKETLEEWRDHLLKYCCLDTLAMVKVWEKLKEIVKD